MTISSVSMNNDLAGLATNMQSKNIGLELSTAILKQTMDIQKQQGAALVAMINQTPSIDGTGQRINVAA